MFNLSYSDIVAPATRRDAIPFFSHLRTVPQPLEVTGHPLGLQLWLIADYDLANTVLRDQRFAKDIFRVLPAETIERTIPHLDLFRSLGTNMLNSDLADHTRLRLLVSKVFTPRMIEQLRTRIQEITDQLLDTVQPQGQMELIRDFAYLLPITVISEMLGIPTKDREKFRLWSDAVIGDRGFLGNLVTKKDLLTEFVEYMQALIDQKRAEPTEDLLSKLVQVEEEGDKLSEIELTSLIMLLIIAGHETTANLIGSGVLALLDHPDQLQMLRDNGELLPRAIEELLRYTAPLLLTITRWVSEDIELNGKQLKKGDVLHVALLAADLDPTRFRDPERFDITREENAHLAFGKGVHYCLGAPLARLEGQIAIETLLRRMPHLRLAVAPEELEWRSSLIMRGLSSLPVVF